MKKAEKMGRRKEKAVDAIRNVEREKESKRNIKKIEERRE